jgi:hypothetical protein
LDSRARTYQTIHTPVAFKSEMLQPLIDICLKGGFFRLGVFGLTFASETLLWKVWIAVFWLRSVSFWLRSVSPDLRQRNTPMKVLIRVFWLRSVLFWLRSVLFASPK